MSDHAADLIREVLLGISISLQAIAGDHSIAGRRERIATACLQGLLDPNGEGLPEENAEHWKWCAKAAVLAADSLIAELSRPKTGGGI